MNTYFDWLILLLATFVFILELVGIFYFSICVGNIIYCLTNTIISVIYKIVGYRPGHIKEASNGKAIWFAIRVLKENKEDEKAALEITKTNKIDYLKFVFNKLKASLFPTNNDKPLLWIPLDGRKEKADWLLMRGEYIYEMPFAPPAMYFMNIKPDPNMKFYYQPLNLCPYQADSSYLSTEFSSAEKSSGVPHIIFVIHGIGHHENEERVVENANDIREGFINYLKKFHPALPTPIIIPIAWRCDLPMDDKQIQASHSLKFEMAKRWESLLISLCIIQRNIKMISRRA